MAISYNWSISELERNISDGGVTVAHWRCDAIDGNYRAASYGSCILEYDASASDFIAYDNLTEANVIGWVQNIVDQSNIEDALSDKINEDKTPTKGSGVPW